MSWHRAIAAVALAAAACGGREETLVDALGGRRATSGWHSSLGAYAPYRAIDGPVPLGQLSPAALRAYSRSSIDTAARPGAGDFVRAAGGALETGRPADAVAFLSEAIDRDGQSWAAWNDLSVARLSLATSGPAAWLNLTGALDAALRARALAPSRLEPAFNIALLAGRLGLSDESKAARDSLRRQGADRRWLAELTQPIAARTVSGTTPDAIMTELFPEWGRAELARSRGQTEEIERRIESATSAASRSGDRQFSECLAAAQRRSSPAARDELARAHIAYGKGRAAYESSRLEDARAAFSESAGRFAKISTPCRWWPALDLVTLRYRAGDVIGAIDEYRRLIAATGDAPYLTLRARQQWLVGVALVASGRVEDGARAYSRAVALYRKTGDEQNRVSAESAAADGLRELGAQPDGWPYLLEALQHVDELDSPRRQYLILYNAALYSADAGFPRAALAFQEAALAAARKRAAPNTIVEALVQHARRALDAGELNQARADLDAAADALTRVTSADSVTFQRAWLERTRAEAGIARATISPESVSFFEHRSAPELPAVRLSRGRSQLSAGDTASASTEFAAGVEAAGALLARLSQARYRVAMLDGVAGLREAQIELALARGDSDLAFDLAEDAHAGRLSAEATLPRGAARSLASRLSPKAAAIVYFVMQERVLAWTVRRDGITLRQIPIRRADLESRVSAFRRLIESSASPASARSVGDGLARSLLDPRAATAEQLIVVPDGALYALPFAALPPLAVARSPIRLSLAPTATFIGSSAASARAPSTALVIGAAANSEFPKLPAAPAELRDVAAAYRVSQSLTGSAASPSALRARIGSADVVHFAGHASADFTFPWASFLVLAPDPAHPSGLARLDDLERLELRRARLVVLSGCETALGARFRGTGPVTLARPFLDGGAEAVVGALWRIDDEVARQFMRELHAQFSRGRTATEALTAARAALAGNSDARVANPATWAAFVVFDRQAGR